MAWNFTNWKTFAGGGAVATVVMFVAGMLVTTEPWFNRENANYMVTRDYLEIIGGVAERETAFASDTNFVPLTHSYGWDYATDAPWWYGRFAGRRERTPSWAGWDDEWEYVVDYFATNAVGLYDAKSIFSGLNNYAHLFFPVFVPGDSPTIKSGLRYWVSTNAAGVVAAAGSYSGGADGYSIMAATNAYWMLDAWWNTNVYDGETRYPATNHYENTTVLCAIKASMESCRYMLAPHYDNWYEGVSGVQSYSGATSDYVYVSGDLPPDWSGTDKSWGELAAAAHAIMLTNAAEIDWEKVGCLRNEGAVVWSCKTHDGSWLDGAEWRHYTYDARSVYVGHTVNVAAPTVDVVGTNVTGIGLGRPALCANGTPFYHAQYGSTMPTTLQTKACTVTNVALNLYRVFNEVLRFDGLMSTDAMMSRMNASEGFPPTLGESDGDGTGDGWSGGWQQYDGQSGIMLDWTFEHFVSE